jgi:hypothetical protein
MRCDRGKVRVNYVAGEVGANGLQVGCVFSVAGYALLMGALLRFLEASA